MALTISPGQSLVTFNESMLGHVVTKVREVAPGATVQVEYLGYSQMAAVVPTVALEAVRGYVEKVIP